MNKTHKHQPNIENEHPIETSIRESKITNTFIVHDVDTIRQRIEHAEKSGDYMSHEEFWREMDKKLVH